MCIPTVNRGRVRVGRPAVLCQRTPTTEQDDTVRLMTQRRLTVAASGSWWWTGGDARWWNGGDGRWWIGGDGLRWTEDGLWRTGGVLIAAGLRQAQGRGLLILLKRCFASMHRLQHPTLVSLTRPQTNRVFRSLVHKNGDCLLFADNRSNEQQLRPLRLRWFGSCHGRGDGQRAGDHRRWTARGAEDWPLARCRQHLEWNGPQRIACRMVAGGSGDRTLFGSRAHIGDGTSIELTVK